MSSYSLYYPHSFLSKPIKDIALRHIQQTPAWRALLRADINTFFSSLNRTAIRLDVLHDLSHCQILSIGLHPGETRDQVWRLLPQSIQAQIPGVVLTKREEPHHPQSQGQWRLLRRRQRLPSDASALLEPMAQHSGTGGDSFPGAGCTAEPLPLAPRGLLPRSHMKATSW